MEADQTHPQKNARSQHPADDADEGPSSQRSTLSRFVGVMLAVYWVTLFVVMHVRFSPPSVAIPGADKVVHLVAYGMLGLLFTLWIVLQRPLSVKVLAGIVLTIAVYGAADELLQIPFGRTCDMADWVFDMIGGVAGVALVKWLTGGPTPSSQAHRIG